MRGRRGLTDAEREASRWIARLEADDVSLEDHQRFRAWLAQSEENRAAHRAVSNSWDKLDALGLLGAGELPAARRLSRRALLLGGAGALAAIGAAGALWFSTSGNSYAASYQTAIGGRQRIILPDGSSIELNADTALEVRFSRTLRLVSMPHGEALFNVRPALLRPLIVATARARFVARGTSFLLKTRAESARLTVLEGEVVIDRDGASSARVLAGEEARVSGQAEQVSRLEPDKSAQRLAWRTGALVFDGEPLAEAVAEVERQTGAHFEFADPAIGASPIGGYLASADIEAFTALLEANLELTVSPRANGVRVVNRRS